MVLADVLWSYIQSLWLIERGKKIRGFSMLG